MNKLAHNLQALLLFSVLLNVNPAWGAAQYHSLDPIPLSQIPWHGMATSNDWRINLNGGTNRQLRIIRANSDPLYSPYIESALLYAEETIQFLVTPVQKLYHWHVALVNVGERIGPTPSETHVWLASSQAPLLYHSEAYPPAYFYSEGNFLRQSGLIPFRIVSGNDFQYGWLQVEALDDGRYYITGYALEDVAGRPIVAGEFEANTDTVPRTSISYSEGQVSLSFPTRDNRIYEIWASSDLSPNGWWGPLDSRIGTGGNESVLLPASDFTQQFYRLQITDLAPGTTEFAGLVVDQTLSSTNYHFTNTGRFDASEEFGNWTFSKTGANTATIVFTYDKDKNRTLVYREEIEITFLNKTNGTYDYYEYQSDELVPGSVLTGLPFVLE